MIIGDRQEVRLVYLRGSREIIGQRLAGRHGHFMPPSLLQSQFEALEDPAPEEEPLVVDIGPPAGQIAEEIIRLLGASAGVGQTAS
jgi:gluconate kinase